MILTSKAGFLPSGSFVRKKFDRIFVAAILAWFVALVNNCADAFLAGAFLNESAVSAIALVEPFASGISFVAYLVSVGTAVMFSRESGAFRRENASRIVGQGFICSALFSIILVAVMLVLRDPIMTFYGASEEITALAVKYYSCEIFFAALYPYYFLIYQLISVDGDEVVGFLACVGSAAANLVFSIIMVKPYGIQGLAFGTIFGAIVGLCIYCTHFFRKSNSVRCVFWFNIKELGKVVKISSSTSMTLLYIAVIDIVMNRFVISHFSDAYLPAYAVVNFILNLGAVFCSLYDASSGFISVAYGENNPDSIRKTMRIAYRSAAILAAFMIVFLELVAPAVPSLFGITDPGVFSASVYAVRVIAIACPATALYYLFCSYYPTVGHVLLGHVISIIYMLLSPLALAIPLGIAFGFSGLSWGFMLTSVVAVVLTGLFIRIKHGRKAVPLMLEDTDEESVSFDLRLSKETIVSLCVSVKEYLEQRGVPSKVINEVQMMLEEGYLTILEQNPKKKVSTECILLLSDRSLRLITRDNGRIFDITDANAKVKDFRSYVLARLMEQNPDRSNTTTISFNRNSYLWDLQKIKGKDA